MGFRSSGRHLDRSETVAFREAAADGGLGRRRARQREPPAPFVGAASATRVPGSGKEEGHWPKTANPSLAAPDPFVRREAWVSAHGQRTGERLVLHRGSRFSFSKARRKSGKRGRGPCVGDSRAAAGRHARAWRTRPGGPRFSCKARARIGSSRDVLVGRVGLQKSSGVADGPEKRSTSSS